MVAGTSANAKEIKEQMKKFDHDEDGKINFNEFCACMLGIESTTGIFGTAAMVRMLFSSKHKDFCYSYDCVGTHLVLFTMTNLCVMRSEMPSITTTTPHWGN